MITATNGKVDLVNAVVITFDGVPAICEDRSRVPKQCQKCVISVISLYHIVKQVLNCQKFVFNTLGGGNM